MSDSKKLIEQALKATGFNQKQLAARLGVSPPQITKWKNNEYMSNDMKLKISALVGTVDEDDIDDKVLAWAGSPTAARKWQRLFSKLAEYAEFGAETGYVTDLLSEDDPMLAVFTVIALADMGVKPPKTFPKELEKLDGDDTEGEETEDEILDNNPYADLISQIYAAYVDVWGFYTAYVEELVREAQEDDDKFEDFMDLEPNLLALAASKITRVDPELAPNFRHFKYQTEKDYREWLTKLKIYAITAGIPIRAETLDLVNMNHDTLSEEAERESLGFNGSQLHPDIYMNELVTGMKIIHQVLPAILKKLDMTDEFKLKSFELHNYPERDRASVDGEDDGEITEAPPAPIVAKFKLVDAGNGQECKLGQSATILETDRMIRIVGFDHDVDGAVYVVNVNGAPEQRSMLPATIGVRIVEVVSGP